VDSHNLYAFNGFDSINFVDPWGLDDKGLAAEGKKQSHEFEPQVIEGKVARPGAQSPEPDRPQFSRSFSDICVGAICQYMGQGPGGAGELMGGSGATSWALVAGGMSGGVQLALLETAGGAAQAGAGAAAGGGVGLGAGSSLARFGPYGVAVGLGLGLGIGICGQIGQCGKNLDGIIEEGGRLLREIGRKLERMGEDKPKLEPKPDPRPPPTPAPTPPPTTNPPPTPPAPPPPAAPEQPAQPPATQPVPQTTPPSQTPTTSPSVPVNPPPFPGWDPTKPPSPDHEWRGKQPVGGDKGGWFNPKTGETLHPDLEHGPPGPHWDWIPHKGGDQYRIFPDGRVERKKPGDQR
jgi:hypothetical protein